MADKKITDLTENTTPVGTDLIEMVDDPAGTPLSQKTSFANVTKALSVMVGDSGSGGTKGLAPAPAAGDAAAGKFLKADGTYAVPPTGGAPTGAAGGDLGGTYPNPTVAQSSTAFALTGDISPAQITSNQNNYNPTGLSTASTLRLDTDASRDITGLQGGADGRIIIIHNVGANAIVLKDEDANSTAGNRFALTADVTLNSDHAALLQYDATSSRWRLVAGPSSAGGSSQWTTSGSNIYYNNPVGIGNTGPTSGYKLEVSQSTAANSVAAFFNSDTGANAVKVDWKSAFSGLANGSDIAGRILFEPDAGTASRLAIQTTNTSGTLQDSLKITAAGLVTFPGNKASINTNGGLDLTNIGASINAAGAGAHLNLPASGNSTMRIGNIDIGYAGGGYFSGAASADSVWRNTGGKILIGLTGGAANLTLQTGTLKFSDTAPAHIPRTSSQITSSQNNYNPGGFSRFQRWSSDASRDVTGLTFSTTQEDGQEHVIVNVGSNDIVLKHQDANSTAANRFLNSTGADITLTANQAADVIYDGTTQRWRVFKRN